MNNQKKLQRGIFIFLAAFLGVFIYFGTATYLKSSGSFDSQLMKIASEYNKSCPITINAMTRLDNMIAMPNKTIQYNYTLTSWVKDSVNVDEITSEIKPLMINAIKTSPELKMFRENDVIFNYSYKDKNGNFVTKIVINPEDYY